MQFQQPSTQQFAQSGSASGLAPTSQTGQGVPWSTAHQIPAGSMQLQGMVPPQEAIQRPYDQMENLVQPRRPPWIQPPNTQTMLARGHQVPQGAQMHQSVNQGRAPMATGRPQHTQMPPRTMPQDMNQAQRNAVLHQQRLMAAQQAASAQAQASQMNSNSQYYRHPQQMSPQQPGSPAGMVQQQHVQRNPAAVNGMMSHPQTPVSVGPSPSPVLSQPSAAYPNHAQTHNVELYRQQQAQAQAQAQVRQRQHLRAELPQRSQSLHAIPASTSAMAPPAHMRPSTPASIHSAHGPSQSPEQAFSVQPSPRHAAAQPPQMRAQQQQQPQQVAQAPRASVAGATPPTPSQSLQSQRLPTMPSGMSRVMKCLDDLSEICSSDQTTMSDIVAFVQEYFVEHATITINLKGRASSRSSEEQRQQQHRESNSDAGEQKDAKTISYSFPPVALVSFFFSMRATGMKSCQLYLARCAEFTVDPADTTTPDDQYTRIESRHFSMLTSSFHKADGHPSPNDSNGITSHSTVLGRMSSRLSKQPVHSPSSLQNGQPISGYTWRLETFKLVFEQQFISVDITQLAMEPTVLDLTGQQHLKLGSNGAALTEGRHTNSSLFDNTSPDAPQTSDLSRTTSAPGQETAQARTVRQFADSLTCPNFLDRLHEWLQLASTSVAAAELMSDSNEQGIDPLALLSSYGPLVDQGVPQDGAIGIQRSQSAFEPQHHPHSGGLVSSASTGNLKRKLQDTADIDTFLEPPSPFKRPATSSGGHP